MKNELEQSKAKGIVNVSILNSPTKIASSIFIGLAGFTAAWAFLAPIPVKVSGLGILAPVDGLFTYKSPSAGRILLPFVYNEKSAQIKYSVPEWSKKAYQFISDGEGNNYEDSVDLTQQILDYIQVLQTTRMPASQFSGGVESGGDYTVKMEDGDVIAIIDKPAARQALRNNLMKLQQSISNYKNLIAIHKESLELSRNVETAKKGLIDPLNNLVEEGFASRLEFNNALAEATRSRIGVTDYTSKLQDVQLDIKKNQASLIDALSEFIRDSVIFAFDEAYVQSFATSQWDFVSVGAEIMTVSWSKVAEPSIVPVFVDQKAATEVEIGQEVILTPLGFSASEVGGIKGQIASLEPIPFTTATLSTRLNSQGLAAIVSPRGSAYQVNVKLLKQDIDDLRIKASSKEPNYKKLLGSSKDNTGGYVWNNRSNPPIAPREGFLLASQITTRMRTPIEMLIPAVKELTGLAAPNKLIRFNLNQE
ncbi:hypothetical protein MITS9509_01999 [Synechococcus sp. MIT S9509]|uniref:hypothetical protein n=1 Tax=Synechococcus sp. MIT S9509 TaxID=1801630 RepID=UPI0007BB0CAC|nr:hypothetical protein [Synechococcus sp. MIT S9509]KZR92078.1 hypothetical protein MITS9509_01999 [Synechococcus sp. MIT S9509]